MQMSLYEDYMHRLRQLHLGLPPHYHHFHCLAHTLHCLNYFVYILYNCQMICLFRRTGTSPRHINYLDGLFVDDRA